MKKLKTYLLKLNKKYIFLLGVLFFTLSCNKNNTERNEVLVSVVKKEKLDRNSLLITLLFKNKSNKNYVMPVYPEYNLVKSKGGIINYGNIDGGSLMNISGKIVSSDFADQMEDWEKGTKLLSTFYRKTYFNYKGAGERLLSFAMHDSEAYSSCILFLPKKSERKMIICFNSYKINNGTLFDKKTRVSVDWESYEPRMKILDSLLKKENINYTVYRKIPYLKDSLLIN